VSSRPRTILVAAASALATALAANAVEVAFNHLARTDQTALQWISDLVLATGFALVAYLWLHLRETRTELERLERARIAFDTELSLASRIQRNLLPPVPAPTAGLRLAARMEPAERVGGDFYDFLSVDPSSLFFVLGDVSGKGIPAALLMASTRSFFRSLAPDCRNPQQLARRLSEALWADNGGTPYATAIVGRFDLQDGVLSYVNAGHPPGVILGPEGCRVAASTGPPLGILQGATYSAEQIALSEGDIGAFVTDGITEAVDAGALTRASTVVEAALRRVPLPATPEAICDLLMRLAHDGAGPAGAGDWHDDRTVVAFVLGPRGGAGPA
jgi:sigma-B regulation protein RsbU (phosphoserine phosphatase)